MSSMLGWSFSHPGLLPQVWCKQSWRILDTVWCWSYCCSRKITLIVWWILSVLQSSAWHFNDIFVNHMIMLFIFWPSRLSGPLTGFHHVNTLLIGPLAVNADWCYPKGHVAVHVASHQGNMWLIIIFPPR